MSLCALAFIPPAVSGFFIFILRRRPGWERWMAWGAFTLGWWLFLSHASIAPEARVFGPVLARGSAGGKTVALTFDDGPNGEYTKRLLDVLNAHGARASFFVVGHNVKRHPGLVLRMAREGHSIGNHSYSHRPFPRRLEIAHTQRILETLLGRAPRLFRPPYGLRDPRLHRDAGELGLITVNWSVLGGDWGGKWREIHPERIARQVLKRIHPGAIVLLHDGDRTRKNADQQATIEAVDRLIPLLRARGYRFVTLDELLVP